MEQQPKQGEDYYFNEEGLMVMTEAYHLKRGYCCENDCKHCAYDFNGKNQNASS